MPKLKHPSPETKPPGSTLLSLAPCHLEFPNNNINHNRHPVRARTEAWLFESKHLISLIEAEMQGRWVLWIFTLWILGSWWQMLSWQQQRDLLQVVWGKNTPRKLYGKVPPFTFLSEHWVLVTTWIAFETLCWLEGHQTVEPLTITQHQAGEPLPITLLLQYSASRFLLCVFFFCLQSKKTCCPHSL